MVRNGSLKSFESLPPVGSHMLIAGRTWLAYNGRDPTSIFVVTNFSLRS